ncbi:MAG: hypothetical protein HYU85_03710 [Chloroflexi bacterium]|nr:hypothetical protein [Chloroflexota bacterium]
MVEKVTLQIAKSTKLLDAQGSVLKSLSASELTSPSPPPSGSAIVYAYDFGPDGAIFAPAITLSMNYAPEALPEGMLADELSIAYWDGSRWQSLTSLSYPELSKVEAKVSHFTQFAIIGKLKEATAAAIPTGFEISNLTVNPGTVEAGESVTIAAVVTNLGDSRDSFTVVLKINGVAEASRQVTLDAGIGQTVHFDVSRSSVGSYEIEVGNLTASFVITRVAVDQASETQSKTVVTAEPDNEATVEATPSVPALINWWLIGGIAAGLLIIAITIRQLVVRRRY